MAGPAGLLYLYIPPSSFSSNDLKQALSSTGGMQSSSSIASAADYSTYPLARRHGRTYLRDPDISYPLPCDMTEIHRQTLRSLMLMRVTGSPVCSPTFDDRPPQRVLEVACGAAMWSHACHEHFAKKGHPNVAFYGVDLVNLTPDLQKHGVNWNFKRYDVRKGKLPFPDDFFDLVISKDAAMCPSKNMVSSQVVTDTLRVIKPGGVFEIWETDYVFRSLLPNPPGAPRLTKESHQHASSTGTYTISPATPFAEAQNRYLKDYNIWAEKAFENHPHLPVPSAHTSLTFTAESENFSDSSSRRIAIPLGEIKWEKQPQKGHPPKHLTPDQLAIRHTALMTTIQLVESLDPLLREASGKSRDEWDRWWTGMTTDLMQDGGITTGECLEFGAWWGRKR